VCVCVLVEHVMLSRNFLRQINRIVNYILLYIQRSFWKFQNSAVELLNFMYVYAEYNWLYILA
jgi:hypothetical protein